MNGEMTGQGVATYSNGDVYEGSFVNGKRQGQGAIRFATGEAAQGNWINGALVDPTPVEGPADDQANDPAPADEPPADQSAPADDTATNSQ
jgi:hypothetical protein